MIDSVVSNLRVSVPSLQNPILFDGKVPLVNANPQCGAFPFWNIHSQVDTANGIARFQANLTPEFIRDQILPRGRPHFSLLHAALIDDAVAVSSFSIAQGEPYGVSSRYIELGVTVAFHREAFMEGSITTTQFGTVLVQGFRVYWQCLPQKDNVSLIDRGIFQVSVVGLTQFDEVPVASIEGGYMRRRAVFNTKN